jgi:hypothetical protein
LSIAEADSSTQAELLSIEQAKADKFLESLARYPFIAVVVEEGKVKFFARTDIDSDDLDLIKETIERLSEEDS